MMKGVHRRDEETREAGKTVRRGQRREKEGRATPPRGVRTEFPFLRSRVTEELALVQERRVGVNMNL